MDDLVLTHEDLNAIAAIKRLKAAYCRCVDTQQWDAFVALYVEDGSLEGPGVKWVGRDLVGANVAASLEGVDFSAHHAVMPEITLHDDDHATAIWALNDFFTLRHGATFMGSPLRGGRGLGYYVDEMVRVDGAWRFQSVALHWLSYETVSSAATELPALLTGRA
jgi:hypothetical protein